MASDNSKAIGELKASQDEMKRALAKVPEQSAAQGVTACRRRLAAALRKPADGQRPQVRARPRYPYPQGVALRRLVAADAVIVEIRFGNNRSSAS